MFTRTRSLILGFLMILALYGFVPSDPSSGPAEAASEEKLAGEPPAVFIQGTAKLFESTSCTTNDLEDTENFSFTVPPDQTINQTINLENAGFGGGDTAEITLAVTNQAAGPGSRRVMASGSIAIVDDEWFGDDEYATVPFNEQATVSGFQPLTLVKTQGCAGDEVRVELEVNVSLNVVTNVTADVGLTGVSGFYVSIADVNGDGYPDLLLHQVPQNVPTGCVKPGEPDPCKDQVLYLNVPGNSPNDPHSRKFIDYTEESGIRRSRRGINDRRSNLAVFADVDNDGDLDMFSGIYGHRLENYNDNGDRNDLFLNDGSGHFTLAPNSPFHLEGFWNTTSATFLDYNLDGNIDLFIGNWWKDWDHSISFSDKLYRGSGNGSFIDVTNSAGVNFEQPTYAVSAADTNGDGFMDIFASNYCRDHSIHWQNNGNGTFTQVQASTNYGQYIGEPGGTWRGDRYMTCSWGSMPRDFDNDRDIDLFEIITHGWGDGANGVHSTVVLNENNVFSWDFSRVKGRANDDPDISHHGDHYASWLDIDNDGLADFALTESGYSNDRFYLFKQAHDNTFYLVTSEAGLDSVNTAKLPTHNVTPFDYDLDGDEDLLVGFGSRDGVQLWRNDIGTQNNWLTITLEGAGIPGHSSKSAIGARVEVTAGGKTYTREVYAGNGHFGPQASLSLAFGLGQATKVDTVTVYWPNENRTSVKLNDVAVNQFIKLHELAGKIVVNNDEWPLSDEGFPPSQATDAAQFARNVASWFTGGGPGNFLVYSTRFELTTGLVGDALASTMRVAGHTWTVVSTTTTFSLEDLLQYDGIFLAGSQTDDIIPPPVVPPNTQVLIDYVKAGGNVYLAGGTDPFDVDGRPSDPLAPAREAAQWNPFLNACGLEFALILNDVDGILKFNSSHPIFNNGVQRLFQRDGHSIRKLDPADPSAAILVRSQQGEGLYAVCTIGAPVEGAPTAIDLLSFTAQPAADRVTLTWETGTEVDNAGFNLWRSQAADGPYTKINDALIPAEGDAHSGASYTYTDTDVVKGVTYYYKLEDVDVHGVSTFHGPVSATPSPIQQIYLPLLLK